MAKIQCCQEAECLREVRLGEIRMAQSDFEDFHGEMDQLLDEFDAHLKKD